MKVLFYTYVLLGFITLNCKGQSKVNISSDQVSFHGKLKQYKIDNCMIHLMEAIVKADSGGVNYPPNYFFYELDFERKPDSRTIYISPSRWHKSSSLNYKGIITVGNMSFLCLGNFEEDSLFKKTENDIDVVLQRPKLYRYDSIDVKIEMFSYKPSLIGKYKVCSGPPIDLYIHVGKKLEGYSTKKEK